MTISSQEIGGYPAYTIAAPRLAITCLPTRGAHLVSMRSGDHEWLWAPSEGPALLPIGPDGDFSPHQEGCDDCFPTIIEDVVQGVIYPKHGSVWNRPWRIVSTNDVLELAIDVPDTGLECRRRMPVDGDGLRLEWQITNRADKPAFYLWGMASALPLASRRPLGHIRDIKRRLPGTRQTWPDIRTLAFAFFHSESCIRGTW